MSNRAECEAVVRQLWPFLDGFVQDEHREQIIRHLEECASCRSHVDYAAEFLDAVAAVPVSKSIDMAGLERRVVTALAAAV